MRRWRGGGGLAVVGWGAGLEVKLCAKALSSWWRSELRLAWWRGEGGLAVVGWGAGLEVKLYAKALSFWWRSELRLAWWQFQACPRAVVGRGGGGGELCGCLVRSSDRWVSV